MRSGLYSSLLTLLGAAGLVLTQGPVQAQAPQSPAATGGRVALNGPVVDADAAPATGSGPVIMSGPVPVDGHGDYAHAPSVAGAGADYGCCGTQDYQWWGRAEFLLYRFTNSTLPPLTLSAPVGVVPVTPTTTTFINGTLSGLPVASPTSSLPLVFQVTPTLGSGSQVDFGDIPGGRFTIGYWFEREHCLGLEWSFFALDRQDFDFSNASGSTGMQTFPTGLANTTLFVTGIPPTTTTTASLTPIVLTGSASSTLSGSVSSEMWGTELNVICHQCSIGGLRYNCLVGMRYINLNEDVTDSESVSFSATLPGTPPTAVASTATFFDHVTVHDHFIGPQVGIDYDWCIFQRVSLDGSLKVALGDMHEAFSLVGFNTGTGTAGGLLVGPSDTGAHRKRDRIAGVPELNINLSYHITPRCRVYVGYDAFYLSSLARFGGAITTAATNGLVSVGGTTVPVTLITPAFNPVGADMWVEGINAGLEFRF
jgi:hypothetical protein